MYYKRMITFWGLFCFAFTAMAIEVNSIKMQQADMKMLARLPFRNDNNHDDFLFPKSGQAIYQFMFVVKKSAVGFEKIEIVKVDGSREEFKYRYKLLDDTDTHIFTLNKPNIKVAKIRVWHTVRPREKRKGEVELWAK